MLCAGVSCRDGDVLLLLLLLLLRMVTLLGPLTQLITASCQLSASMLPAKFNLKEIIVFFLKVLKLQKRKVCK